MTPYALAVRYLGVTERPGALNHPLIQWWFELCHYGDGTADEVPWCSAFINGVAWELGLLRSNSAAARSWLDVGTPLELVNAQLGWDVVVFERGAGGHVGFYVAQIGDQVAVLGGNQSNTVSVALYPVSRVLGVRRLG